MTDKNDYIERQLYAVSELIRELHQTRRRYIENGSAWFDDHEIKYNEEFRDRLLKRIKSLEKLKTMKKDKNFLYPIAVKNYDQGLIDWCDSVGYNTECINGDQNRYIVTGYCDESGLLVNKYSSHDDIDGYRYIIDYKEHPELTKALLAAVDDKKIYPEEMINANQYGIVRVTNADNINIYFVDKKCHNHWKRIEDHNTKPTLNQLLNHFSCKLSGKEIVSKKKMNEDISQRMAKLKKQTRKLIKERNKLYEGKKKKQFIRKGKTEIVFECFNPSKKVLDGFNLIKGSGINWSKEAYLDRLRTERDRLRAKIEKVEKELCKGSLLPLWCKLERLHANMIGIEKKLNKELLSFSYDEKEFEKTINSGFELSKECQESINFLLSEKNTSKSTFIERLLNFDIPDINFDIIDKNCIVMYKGKDINPNNKYEITLKDQPSKDTPGYDSLKDHPTTSKEITIKCKRKDCNHYSKKKCNLKCPEFVSGGYCGSYDKVVEMDIDNRKYTIHSEGVACWDFKLTFADMRTIMFNYYDKFLSHNMYNIGTESMRINKHIVSISAINALWEKMKELKNAKT